ncbi:MULTISPECIES: hypothetical protein [unclassified Streptomyces]|uniref:hypothetical protein n=1 Tax=unclassified Streptomyces TaxID=2593676 RepID=UPI00380E1747
MEVIEPRKKLAKNLVRHVGVQGQLQALIVWPRFSHTKKGTIELTILESACQHMGYVRFQTPLMRIGGICDRGPEIDIGLLSQPGSIRERE